MVRRSGSCLTLNCSALTAGLAEPDILRGSPGKETCDSVGVLSRALWRPNRNALHTILPMAAYRGCGRRVPWGRSSVSKVGTKGIPGPARKHAPPRTREAADEGRVWP
ncbi:hypothetical protein EV126DRAFT_92174 [Verticillium dahliae]|nr:hypothetical protein EV126DRAFT_92174 [Verticillium dahliae]